MKFAEKKYAEQAAPAYMYMLVHESNLVVPGTNHQLVRHMRRRFASPHNFRHTYRAWFDELGRPITVRQRAMRQGVRVTMNYGETMAELCERHSQSCGESHMPMNHKTDFERIAI